MSVSECGTCLPDFASLRPGYSSGEADVAEVIVAKNEARS